MKIVDLETAQNLLHRSTRGPSLSQPPPGKEQPPPPPPPAPSHHIPPGGAGGGNASSWDQYHGPPPHGGGREERGRGGQPLPPQGDYNRMRVRRIGQVIPKKDWANKGPSTEDNLFTKDKVIRLGSTVSV